MTFALLEAAGGGGGGALLAIEAGGGLAGGASSSTVKALPVTAKGLESALVAVVEVLAFGEIVGALALLPPPKENVLVNPVEFVFSAGGAEAAAPVSSFLKSDGTDFPVKIATPFWNPVFSFFKGTAAPP